MSETYNLGRVVGWSTYEQFLKDHADTVDPSVISESMYQTMVTYGVSRLVDLSTDGWSGNDLIKKKTIEVPGAVWGVVPIIGLNHAACDGIADADVLANYHNAISCIHTCYVSNSTGTKATSSRSRTGYLTFCASPDITEIEVDILPLIVRGLGAEAFADGNVYFGPQGIVTGIGTTMEPSHHETVSEGGIVEYNTRNIYFMYEDSNNLGAMKTCVQHSVITGVFSKEFMDKVCVPGEELTNYAQVFGGLINAYIEQVPEEDRNQYVGLVNCQATDTLTENSNQISCWIIHKQSGTINLGLASPFSVSSFPGFNFKSGSGYNQELVKMIGGWWNSGSNSPSMYDDKGAVIIENTGTQKSAITDIEFLYQPTACAPKVPEEYSCAAEWFSAIPLKRFVQQCGQTFAQLNIHEDYQNLSLLQFLQEFAIRDVSQPRTVENLHVAVGVINHNIFSKSALDALLAKGITSNDWKGQALKSDGVAIVDAVIGGFFSARAVTFKVKGNLAKAFDETSDGSELDITNLANSISNSRWVAKNYRKDEINKAVSLVDEYNSPLPLGGTAGSIESDSITWDRLLSALNHNEKLDVLGGLKDAKKSIVGGGNNYVEFKAGDGTLRLYVSTTPPTGDIPVGSIGIGW